ncbi:DUF1772 domain-containing protein [Nocardia aurantiaca]|uniref:DUF1772 domain-containing protein n=1 Tax=Nocardia aurantiaca TaxID=2675850 RepID=A0A6I3KVI1_9NOCA|nr:DUF1772 domain-containing protein [Nocardia aurantiaca]MTE12550.1 DUF1772 domain-containing protein [Nocardia aurantiaca]
MKILFLSAIGISIMTTAVVYGTDFFCALVLRTALARIDDRALTATTGRIHEVADRRMPIPGAVGVVAAVVAAGLAFLDGRVAAGSLTALAVATLAVWLGIYARISAPVNKELTAAVRADRVPADVREMQRTWDSVIVVRVVLQGIALVALFLAALSA